MGLDSLLADRLYANTAATRDLEKKVEVLTNAMEFNSILKLYELGLITEEELKNAQPYKKFQDKDSTKKGFFK